MKIIYKNQTSDEVYNNNIENVKKIIEKYSKHLGFDLNLIVYFQEKSKEVEKAAAEIIKKDEKWFILRIYDYLFTFQKDYIEAAVFHEFAHIYDVYHASRNPDFNYVNDKSYLKSNVNLNKHTGFLFWTEFFAYYKCFENNFFDLAYEETFSTLVKDYSKILKKSKEIEEALVNGEVKKILTNYMNDIVGLFNDFKYRLARYIASIPFRKKTYDYNKKNKKEFKDVMKIIIDLTKLVHKMRNGTYGKHMGNRLSKIGTYINEKILSKFNLEVNIHRGNIRYNYSCVKEIEEEKGD